MINRLSKRNGFTLIELLTVVVMIGILTALAAPNFDQALRKIKFKASSNSIMAGLRVARSNAISKRMQYGVNFNVENNVVSVFQDSVDPGGFSLDAGDSIIFHDSLSSGIAELVTSFPSNSVFFFPDGRASSSGTVSGLSECDGGLASVQISVLAATGRVKLDSLTY